MKALLVVLGDIASWSIWRLLAQLLVMAILLAIVGFLAALVIQTVEPVEGFSLKDLEPTLSNFMGLVLLGIFTAAAIVFAGMLIALTVGVIALLIAYFAFEFKDDLQDYIYSVKQRSRR